MGLQDVAGLEDPIETDGLFHIVVYALSDYVRAPSQNIHTETPQYRTPMLELYTFKKFASLKT